MAYRGLCPAVLLAALLAVSSTPLRAENVDVNLDQARILKLPERVSTIVIGNPLIADAALQSGGILVITGKGYGATNLIALDRQGRVLMDKNVVVSGPVRGDIVWVQKGLDRETYSCTPDCAPRITLGDTPAYFGAVIGQTGTRNGTAGGAAAAAK